MKKTLSLDVNYYSWFFTLQFIYMLSQQAFKYWYSPSRYLKFKKITSEKKT